MLCELATCIDMAVKSDDSRNKTNVLFLAAGVRALVSIKGTSPISAEALRKRAGNMN
ncbi:hypothetical protein CMUST_03530 [Corynebacterium mustelae]|uniref:Uncharacterized protein n=1 Tax=Corynebacterium mustelae TaxID=571915 RepID=A0A0G3GWW9_9CORY|nr:hypothetical protein CMUST_03530 [Corynebacterium mustelae]